jgi:transcriptional regulator with XRE-family HTH domain
LSEAPEETLGQLIKREREKRGWSQRDLAGKAGVSNNFISQLEKNYSPSAKDKVARPTIEKIDRVANALGLSIAKLRMLAAKTAGYLSPQNSKPDGFDESEFALMYQDVAKLTAQQKRDFKIAWDMARDALRRIKGED